MSHKDAPPLTSEQQHFEAAVLRHLHVGDKIGMGRDKHGIYLSERMREYYGIWQAARVYCA